MLSKLRKVFAVLLVGVLAACHSGAKLDKNAKADKMAGAVGTQGLNSNPNAATRINVDELDNPSSPLAQRSIYFDFDKYDVKDDYQPLLQAHAQYLKNHPARHLLIQGNTDERGTSEYNLALGQKRAEAVHRALRLLGVPDAQMEAVSLGKEKPHAEGHDEAAWAQNRRADLVYP